MSLTMKHLAAALALGAVALGASAPAQAAGYFGLSINAPIGGYGYAPGYDPIVRPAYVAPSAPAPLREDIPALAPGYVWNSGHWEWSGADWRWAPGYAAYVGTPTYSGYTTYSSYPAYGYAPTYGYVAPAASLFIGSGYYGGGYRHHHEERHEERRHWR